mgnify:CR=1 FL=1
MLFSCFNGDNADNFLNEYINYSFEADNPVPLKEFATYISPITAPEYVPEKSCGMLFNTNKVSMSSMFP